VAVAGAEAHFFERREALSEGVESKERSDLMADVALGFVIHFIFIFIFPLLICTFSQFVRFALFTFQSTSWYPFWILRVIRRVDRS